MKEGGDGDMKREAVPDEGSSRKEGIKWTRKPKETKWEEVPEGLS